MAIKDKIAKAYEEGGLVLLLERSSRFLYRELVPTRLDLLINEKAVARKKEGEWIVHRLDGFTRMIPILSEKVLGTRHASPKHQEIMTSLYNKQEFVELEEGDIVFEVGAYIGGYTIPTAEKAKKVYAIDPNAKIIDSLQFNTREHGNVEIIPKAAWNKKKYLQLNQSFYPNDNSILSPDENDIGQSFEVSADKISNMAADRDIDEIDFLKVEAEGVEPEILEGALNENLRIRKIVVDTTAEREGEPTTNEVVKILKNNNYDVRKGSDINLDWSKRIVFGRLKENSING